MFVHRESQTVRYLYTEKVRPLDVCTQGKSDRKMFVHRESQTVRCLYTRKVRP